ncbi:MAG: urea ABC transporter permease subunit UrtB [Desulfarculales bacterium]|jgi:urea transport system permease protein|nr:urea ABC transporter permease subunit UrtB [Desulfarculales bacterium]
MIRHYFRLLFMLLPLLWAAAPGSVLAGQGIYLPPEVKASLSSLNVNERSVAIAALIQDNSEEAAALLSALQGGVLYVQREENELYLQGPDGFTALTGTEAVNPERGRMRRVGTNIRQRDEIIRFLNIRSLKHPLAETRRKASAALLTAPDIEPATLRGLLAAEEDTVTRNNYTKILAIKTLSDSGAGRAELLAALRELTVLHTPEAQQLIRARRASSDPQIAQSADRALRQTEATIQHIALFETIFFGLSLGSVLVLIAVGLAITFGVMGVINMAHGEMVMLGAYTVWGLQQLLPGQADLAFVLAIPAALLVAGATGALIERTVIRFLYGRPLETLLATFGVSLILQQLARTLISPMNRAVETPAFMSGMWQITEHFSITCGRMYIIVFCLAVFAMIYLVMRHTRLGLSVRAVTQNRAMARAVGVNSSRVDTLTFALGSGVAGMAGVALSQLTNVGPNLGQSYIVDSFMVVVFGGVGNLWGTLAGGLIIGMVNKFLEPINPINGAILAKILIMAGVILFIQKHPRGLFPQKGRAAVQ